MDLNAGNDELMTCELPSLKQIQRVSTKKSIQKGEPDVAGNLATPGESSSSLLPAPSAGGGVFLPTTSKHHLFTTVT